MIALTLAHGWDTATHYLNGTVNFTEPLFVVVIMAIASTRPVVELAENLLRRVARPRWREPRRVVAVDSDPGAAPRLVHHRAGCDDDLPRCCSRGSSTTCSRRRRLKYATLGLLFVNVSIGGTLTHFAAPPVLMVARPWGWDTAFMLAHFGWRAALAIAISTAGGYLLFRREFAALGLRPAPHDAGGRPPMKRGATDTGRWRSPRGSPRSTCCSSRGP